MGGDLLGSLLVGQNRQKVIYLSLAEANFVVDVVLHVCVRACVCEQVFSLILICLAAKFAAFGGKFVMRNSQCSRGCSLRVTLKESSHWNTWKMVAL